MALTSAMKAYVGAYLVLTCFAAYVALSFLGILPKLAEPEANVSPGFIVGFHTAIAIASLVVVGAASFWRSAPRQPWFWLVGTLPGLTFLPDLRPIAEAISRGGSTFAIFLGLSMVVSLGTLVVAAVIAFVQARSAPRATAGPQMKEP